MNELKLSTKDDSLRDILSNGKKYFVPRFQRDYSWESEQLETLWQDVQEMIKNKENYHYMGYLVMQPTDANQYKIIDGQQRLTTFSLFILACIKRLRKINKEKIAEILFRTFIGVEEFDGIHVNRKLTLNKNNDFYYGEAVKGHDLPQRGKKKTVHLMRRAIDYFYKNLQNRQGEAIGELVGEMSDRLLFTTIYIGDELNAYKVFETLNARGVQLSSADLLKNYLFSLIDSKDNIPDEALQELENKWETIGANIGDKYYTDYILCEWNSRHEMTRKSSLFAYIRKEIKDPKSANDYLDLIFKNSDLYEGITNPDSEFFKSNANYQEIKKNLQFLKLFGIKQPFSLLMIAYQKRQGYFHKILQWIQIFSLRYNVICREHPGEQEQLYNRICRQIETDCGVQEIKDKLMELYPNDDKFKRAFADKTLPTKQSNKKARYLLARLEGYQSKTPIDEAELTVEHILPLNPNESWCNEFGDNYDLFTQRIGNMALAAPSLNKRLSQKPFEEKQKLLLESKYVINKNIQNYQEWTSQEVESRQQKLAEIAAKLWNIG